MDAKAEATPATAPRWQSVKVTARSYEAARRVLEQLRSSRVRLDGAGDSLGMSYWNLNLGDVFSLAIEELAARLDFDKKHPKPSTRTAARRVVRGRVAARKATAIKPRKKARR